MESVKKIKLKTIPASLANEFVKQNHYSGKVVPNSRLHFGCYLHGVLHGVISYGSPMDKSNVINLVKTKNKTKNTKWHEMLELNRMAFDDMLPKNSESRCLAISFLLIRKYAPQIKWLLSFADATASGDGAIYRATGFKLTKISTNKTIYVFPDGARIASLSLTNGGDLQARKKIAKKYGAVFSSASSMKPFIDIGAKPAGGYQLRYIYLLDKSTTLNVDEIPFSEIDKIGAGMYKGVKVSQSSRYNVEKHASVA